MHLSFVPDVCQICTDRSPGEPVSSVLVGRRNAPGCVRDQSQDRPTRSQATSLGSHSVLIRDSRRSTLSEPHFGHGGAGFVETERNSSNRSAQASHWYS